MLVVLLIGAACGIVWERLRGAEATHRRIAAARATWASTRNDASLDADGPADSRDAAVALPRGWRVTAARGRLRFRVSGTTVRAETWVLRAQGGSRRAPRRREIVAADAPTGGIRLLVPIGDSADSLLVAPAWAHDTQPPEPAWDAAVRARVARHDDLLAALTIGDDRVVLLALDDPRPCTMLARARLVRDVVAMIP
ncbi:hypothetical protein [Microbacterium sp.]|uniref:hypothetical protein n=1 Tax=Microbacterium sp. TaxID=51671 RepID=UPI003A906756